MEKIINAVIRHDVESICGGDFIPVAESIRNALEVLGFKDFFSPHITEILRTVATNLEEVYYKYFYGTKEKYEQPIELYANIYKNGDIIKEELVKNLEPVLIEDPISYQIRYRILCIVEDLAENLLNAGYIHKFEEEYVNQKAFEDEGDEEED